MLFGLFSFDWTILLVIPGFIISVWAQFKVSNTYEKYSQIFIFRRMTGAEAARQILDRNGLHHIKIDLVRGHLTDHFDPRAGVIRLSESVYGSSTAAAVGVAAHEVGHAIQYAKGYAPIKLRMAILPMTKYGSVAAIPLFVIGLIFANYYLSLAGIILYVAVVLFQLVTLPVEFNASSRALKSLESMAILSDDELQASSKVLNAAALTYVAALLTSILTLLRLLIIFNRGSRK